jgi:hypothetical protein
MITTNEYGKEVELSLYIFIIYELPLGDEDNPKTGGAILIVLPKEFQDFARVFDDEAATKQLPNVGVEYAIEIDGLLPFRPIYRLGVKELRELKSYIDKAKANR